MVIIIESEDTIVKVDNEDMVTWTAAVEKFIEMLRGCGFLPYNFEYVNGEVSRIGDIDEDNDMFEVNEMD
jgi:hypothetical protein